MPEAFKSNGLKLLLLKLEKLIELNEVLCICVKSAATIVSSEDGVAPATCSWALPNPLLDRDPTTANVELIIV